MAKAKRAKRSGQVKRVPGRLADLIGKHPALLEVLDRHGVSFCSGCYLTMTSPLEKVAAYHAVPDLNRFMADVKKALAAKKA